MDHRSQSLGSSYRRGLALLQARQAPVNYARRVHLRAGVISFDPPDSLVALCASLVAQGCQVSVVDNGSSGGLRVLDQCERAGADVLRLGCNTGVSGALTTLVDIVKEEEWLLTLDQDSRISEDFVALLTRSPTVAEPEVAVLGPLVRDEQTGDLVQGDPAATAAYDVLGVITSGSLCRTVALRAVGGFRADLFIDYVDWDLCLRLRAAGWRVVVEPAAEMTHSIGDTRSHRVAGVVPVRASHHSADRQYYKYRNFLLLARSGTLRSEPRWALRHAMALAWGPFKITLLERDRLAKLRAIVAGVRDGLRGRGGPRPTSGADRPSRG
jgi:rhamnosyltransferase